MKSQHFVKAALAAFLLVIIFIAGLEYYWRSQGYQLSYNDDKILWAKMRRQVYEPADRVTVFTGSSRIKWDIDIPTWKKLTGEKAIQLALVGTSAKKVILDLANDEKFAGKLVVDFTILFRLDPRSDLSAVEALKYYHDETPAQRTSAFLGFAMESKLVFLEEGKFGLNNILKEHSTHNRPGIFDPSSPMRKSYGFTTADRQSKFSPLFVNDPARVQDQINRWEERAIAGEKRLMYAKGTGIDSLINLYKSAFDKIRSRGGTVVLLLLPISGNYLTRESRYYPRPQYWDRLVQITKAPGIHYADYPSTAGLVAIEGSHLAPDDAVKYTTSLVETLRKEYGWHFPSDKQP